MHYFKNRLAKLMCILQCICISLSLKRWLDPNIDSTESKAGIRSILAMCLFGTRSMPNFGVLHSTSISVFGKQDLGSSSLLSSLQ